MSRGANNIQNLSNFPFSLWTHISCRKESNGKGRGGIIPSVLLDIAHLESVSQSGKNMQFPGFLGINKKTRAKNIYNVIPIHIA